MLNKDVKINLCAVHVCTKD